MSATARETPLAAADRRYEEMVAVANRRRVEVNRLRQENEALLEENRRLRRLRDALRTVGQYLAEPAEAEDR